MTMRLLAAVLSSLSVACLIYACGTDAPPADSEPVAEALPPATSEPAPPPVHPPAHPPDEAANRLHQGIDVSVHSGAVDWAEVAAEGHGFAILKATEGVDLADAAFDDHWREAAKAGLVRGAYHFYVTEDDPLEQADFFTGRVTLQPGDLAPIVDVELIGHATEDGWQDALLVFVEALHQHYGVPPIVYTSPKFWTTNFRGDVARRLAEYPLWIAEYGVEQPAIPESWTTWHLWQYRGDAPIQGVEKGADLTRVNRQAIDPAALVVPQTAAPAQGDESG